MKKIININFHSRVVPIEETAYDILRKYVDSLKKHFAAEEGGDEIVNDIENRFAELFSDRLKKGATCITDEDVDQIIASMGRPEDFDQDENTGSSAYTNSSSSTSYTDEGIKEEPRRLYRSENDKMLGGVCGGLAAYLKIDSSFVRIIYAALILGSFGSALLIYFILWVALPPKSIETKIRKRLFRDPDHRVIGGVASGLASYFNVEVWIPRVLFCLPLIASAIASIFRHTWFDFDGPVFIANGFGGTLFITYIILWIVLPEARTASEKLEMRGEKIDLASIKNTIKSDLEGFRQKATAVGGEMKERAEQFSSEMKNRSGNIRKDISSAQIPRQGIGHAIGVLFKAFFLFISVIVTFALIMALIGITVGGTGFLPLKSYFIYGFWQNIMIWSTLLLFFILPIVGLLTWLIRRIIGVRSGSHYLGYIFGSLWVVGLISLIFLVATIGRHFNTISGIKEDIQINAPANGKLIVSMNDSKPFFIDSDWMGMNWRHHGPFYDVTDDSLTLNTVRINVIRSSDSAWHLVCQKISRGYNREEANRLASQINFQISQKDSLLMLAPGFSITPSQQFHNQQVLLVIEIPVGRKIYLKSNLEDYRWFNINRNYRNNGMGIEYNITGDDAPSWDSDTEYIMTENGLERTAKSSLNEDRNDNGDSNNDQNGDSSRSKKNKGGYRYHKVKSEGPSALLPDVPSDSPKEEDLGNISPLVLLTRLS